MASNMPLIALSTLALALVSAATTDGAAAQTAVAQKKAVDTHLDDQTMICKREEKTGTRLGGTKVCLTRAEWAAMAANARDAVSTGQTMARTSVPPNDR